MRQGLVGLLLFFSMMSTASALEWVGKASGAKYDVVIGAPAMSIAASGKQEFYGHKRQRTAIPQPTPKDWEDLFNNSKSFPCETDLEGKGAGGVSYPCLYAISQTEFTDTFVLGDLLGSSTSTPNDLPTSPHVVMGPAYCDGTVLFSGKMSARRKNLEDSDKKDTAEKTVPRWFSGVVDNVAVCLGTPTTNPQISILMDISKKMDDLVKAQPELNASLLELSKSILISLGKCPGDPTKTWNLTTGACQ